MRRRGRSRRHPLTIAREPGAIIWRCGCGFMTWRARTLKDPARTRALVRAWVKHVQTR